MMQVDVVIAGGGFGGLSCAKALAEAGLSVVLLERKKAPGTGMHTTGIIVGECAEEFALPDHLTRKVTDVRLYAPNLRYVALQASDYFFLTTDTPALMRHLSDEAIKAGAVIYYGTAYESAREEGDRILVNPSPIRGEVGRGANGYDGVSTRPHPNPPPNGEGISCRFLIGADGPRSRVADDFKLGQNTEFLLGAEAEYSNLILPDHNAFYCFLDQRLAYGYLGWVIPGVDVTQVGLAQRMPKRPDIDSFVQRMQGSFDFSQSSVVARRGGLIPVGGLVQPFARGNVILLGDSAGIVSPLTAGGIHTALHYGKVLGAAIAAHLHHGGQHPTKLLERIYPRFYAKQLLRKSYEHLAPNWLLNVTLTNPIFKLLASRVFFKKKQLK